MRCGKCGKNFDEELYSGVCPKCGYFNNRQKEYDVNKYISTKFEDGAKTSTSTQAAKQHAELHKMYDNNNMHKAGAGSHEQLHNMYDNNNGHRQAAFSSGNQRPGNYQTGGASGKPNPYQPVKMQGNTYRAGQTGSYQQGSFPKSAQYGQNRTYQAAQNNASNEKKNIITPICIVIAILTIAVTAVCCYQKEQSMEEICSTLDFGVEAAQPGEIFEIKDRLFTVDKAKVVDTSALDGMPMGEKLVAVTVEVLPADTASKDVVEEVYVSDGFSYKVPLDDYTVRDILYDGDYSASDGILSQYVLKYYISTEGENGDLYFFVDDNAEEITLSFDEGSEKDGIYALHRRVSVSLQLEEEGK